MPSAETAEATLTRAQLDRATLARRSLLKPTDLDPVAAIERFAALQAQEPALVGAAGLGIGLWQFQRRRMELARRT